MEHIFSQLPTFQSVEEKLDTVLKSDLPRFLEATHTKHEEVRGGIKAVLLSGVFAVAMLVLLYLSWHTQPPTVAVIMSAVTAIWFVLLLFHSSKLVTNNRLLVTEMNMALSPILTNVLDAMVMYSRDDDNAEQVAQLLKESGLCNEQLDLVGSSDSYQIFVDDIEVRMQSIAVASTTERMGGAKAAFSGLLITAPVGGASEGETYGVLCGEKQQALHQSFMSGLAERPDLHEVVPGAELSGLHMRSSNPEQAAALQQRLVELKAGDWPLSTGSWLRFAVKNGMLYVLVSDLQLSKRGQIMSVKLDVVRKAALQTLFPVWHGLALLASIRR